MKVIKVATLKDVDGGNEYCDHVDWLMFDAKAPASMPGALPGGNAVPFDWTLLAGWSWPVPWMLAGGLDADNVAAAVSRSGLRSWMYRRASNRRRGRRTRKRLSGSLRRWRNCRQTPTRIGPIGLCPVRTC